jgi:hypothetical protein
MDLAPDNREVNNFQRARQGASESLVVPNIDKKLDQFESLQEKVTIFGVQISIEGMIRYGYFLLPTDNRS